MTESDNGDTPVGLAWDSAQDGAWVRDIAMRAVIPEEQREQPRGDVVSKTEFDAMARRAMIAESKIEALESDLHTSSMLADEMEKSAEDCLKGREETIQLLGQSTESNSAN